MASAAVDDPADLFGDEGDDGLFGDEDGDQSGQDRRLSDEELDSGDDDDRNDRAPLTPPEDVPQIEQGDDRIAEITIPRQDIPRPTDGELHMFRLPKFLGVEPAEYDSSSFKLPVADHHSSVPSVAFSANATATTTARFRKNANGKLESNTLINKWSDGTYTLLLGDTHYTLEGKPLAPSSSPGTKYQDHLDSHQYIATPYINSQLIHIIGHITNQFTVRPNKEIEDQALARLESSLAAATRGRQKGDNKDGLALISSNQDPEMHKRQAELAEKEKLRDARRKEAADLRAAQQAGRVRGTNASGLNLDELERGSRLSGSKKKRSAPAKPRRARRRADYSSDEDEGPRGRNREDEYDLEDDFLAPSDEEAEEGDGGDDSEEEVDEESEDERPKVKKQKTETKAEADSDVDAEGEIDDAVVPQEVPSGGDAAAARGRRRLVIEDDDDDE